MKLCVLVGVDNNIQDRDREVGACKVGFNFSLSSLADLRKRNCCWIQGNCKLMAISLSRRMCCMTATAERIHGMEAM